MMKKIKVLPQSVYSKIAAGEVIERPASIVRELIDNAVDAGATQVTIQVEKGGLEQIVVLDNGSGIEREDLALALAMHATSKIESIDDLTALQSMGFRGEALYSIQAVSHLTITTQTDPAGVTPGSRLSNYGAEAGQVTSIAHKKGTRVEVIDLFYNLPVRKKFMKSVLTEWNTIRKTVADKALANLDVTFRLYHNGEAVFSTSGSGDFAQTFFAIYPQESPFTITEYEKNGGDDLHLKLFYSAPEVFFSSRKYENLFVNRRPVTLSFFYPAVNTGIKNYVSPGRYPLTYLYITVNPELIDVNIHPAKKEIKFTDQSQVFGLIQNTVAEAMSLLVKREIFPSIPDIHAADNLSNTSVESSKPCSSGQLELYPAGRPAPHAVFDRNDAYFKEVILQETKEKKTETIDMIKPQADYRIIGVIFDTYILVEKDERVYFIDQHAAVEAILFNRKKEKYHQNPAVERLVIPVVFELDKWRDRTEAKIAALNQNRFLIERGEGTTLVLREVPAILLNNKDYHEVIELMIEFLESEDEIDSQMLMDSVLIKAACREAVKKGDKLTLLEIAEITDLYFAQQIKNCPHGRPAHFELTRETLEKTFQRRK